MQKKFILIMLCLFTIFKLPAQNKSNYKLYTIKGFLFLSQNNKDYIDSLKDKHILSYPFLRDIFIPAGKIDTSKSLISNFLNSKLNSGIELSPFDERQKLKSMSVSYSNDTLAIDCYKEKDFSLIPIIIKFKKYSDYPKLYNCGNKVILSNNKRLIKFKYSTPSIDIVSISPVTWSKMK